MNQNQQRESLRNYDYKEGLTELGYKLTDNGDCWRTRALYRKGSNNNSLLIFKKTGVWIDFGSGDEEYQPFSRLIQYTVGEKSSLYKRYTSEYGDQGLDEDDQDYYNELGKSLIKMKKTFKPNVLKKLLPHYSFYESKGISKSTLQRLHGGLAMEKAMRNRFVFPIFNEHGTIDGFSGRLIVENDKAPKWKHTGKKGEFLFPSMMPRSIPDKEGVKVEFPFMEAIEKSGEVLLIESIGDCLSLIENKYENISVSFGVSASEFMVSFLKRFYDIKVWICYNNDSHKDINTGLNSSIKSYLVLAQNFPIENLRICLPTKNDFGEMDAGDFKTWEAKKKNMEKPEFAEKCARIVVAQAKKLVKLPKDEGGIPKKYEKLIKKLEGTLEYYE